MSRFLSVLALLLVTCAGASATTVLPATFDQLVAQADVIFRAVVVDVRSRMVDGPTGRLIVTDVTFRTEHAIKGSVPQVIVLNFMGGTVGDLAMHVGEMPQFAIGDRDILFARPSRREVSPIVGFMQGRFPVVSDPITGTETVRRFDNTALSTTAQLGAPSQPLFSRAFPLSVTAFEEAISREIVRQKGAGRR